MRLFAGLDWGGERHAVCVVDSDGKNVAHFEVAHSLDGLRELRARFAKLAPAAEIPIAIERPTGLIIDELVDAGHTVVAIHPNVVKACRPRYRAAGGKDDLGDAYLLADVLRTDGHRFRPLTPQSDGVKALRAMVRTRDDLVAQRIRLANQLRALLESFWPGAAGVFADIDSLISLAFIQRYATPRAGAKLTPSQLATFLRNNKYSGRRKPAELLERLRAAAVGLTGEAETDAKGELAGMLARLLQSLVEELANLSQRIEADLARLSDGPMMMSFPQAGRINAAQILAELGDVRERFQSEAHLAAEAGVCPVTHASGKARSVAFRRACNKRLRVAVCRWADNSRRSSAWAQDIYARARARGCDHPHAIRVVARAWVRVLWRAWFTRDCYDPTKHGGAKRFLPAA